MKELIIQKLKQKIEDAQNRLADQFIADHLQSLSIDDLQGLLSKVQSGEITL